MSGPVHDAGNMAEVYSALHRNILDVVNEYGVAIMTPSRVADSAQPKLVMPQDCGATPAPPPPGPDG